MTLVRAFVRLDITEDLAFPLSFFLSELAIFAPVVAYFFIGQLVAGSKYVGGDYFTFSAIGIAVSLVLSASLDGYGHTLQRSQNRGQFEMLLAGPSRWLFLPVAMNAWRAILGFINGSLVLLMAAALGAQILPSGIVESLALIILGMGASMAMGVLAASLMVVAKRSQPVLTLYGLASSLLGGALFSIDQLPGWLRWLSFAFPHTYVINSVRTVLMDDPGTFSISFGVASGVLIAFNFVMLIVGFWVLSRSMQYARREGILGGY